MVRQMLDTFDKIYLITCYHSKHRLKDTLSHLKDNGIIPEIFVAPIKRHFPQTHYYNNFNKRRAIFPGKISLACAYEQLFQKCIIDNTQTALFLEDDVVLKDDWRRNISQWNIKDWYILKDGAETHFFAMSLQAMRDYLNKYAMSYNCIDWQINELINCQPNKPSIITTNIATQSSWLLKTTKSTIDVKEDIHTLEF